MKKAVVLLSGGLDSSTVLYWAKIKDYDCNCLLFDYGQRHKKELAAAKKIARRAGCAFQTIKIKLPWDRSSLLNKSQKIPSNLKLPQKPSKNLPSTYVPGRNTIFISFALSYAESIGASVIFIGANAVDFSGYPDCRPDYYRALNTVLKALDTDILIKMPLLNLTKAEIIRLGMSIGVPYDLSWSCYTGTKEPCGKCDSCMFRAKGFEEAGFKDPLLIRS